MNFRKPVGDGKKTTAAQLGSKRTSSVPEKSQQDTAEVEVNRRPSQTSPTHETQRWHGSSRAPNQTSIAQQKKYLSRTNRNADPLAASFVPEGELDETGTENPIPAETSVSSEPKSLQAAAELSEIAEDELPHDEVPDDQESGKDSPTRQSSGGASTGGSGGGNWLAAKKRDTAAAAPVKVKSFLEQCIDAIPDKRKVHLLQMAREIKLEIESGGERNQLQRLINMIRFAADPDDKDVNHKFQEVRDRESEFQMFPIEQRVFLIRELAKLMPGVPQGLTLATKGGARTVGEWCLLNLRLDFQPKTWFVPLQRFYELCAGNMDDDARQQLDSVIDEVLAEASVAGSSPQRVLDDIKAALAKAFGFEGAQDLVGMAKWQLACLSVIGIGQACQELALAFGAEHPNEKSIRSLMSGFLRAKHGSAAGYWVNDSYQEDKVPKQFRGFLEEGPHRVFERISKKHELEEDDAGSAFALLEDKSFNEKLLGEVEKELKRMFDCENVKHLPIEFCNAIASLTRSVEDATADFAQKDKLRQNAMINHVALRFLGPQWSARSMMLKGGKQKMANAINNMFLDCIKERPRESGYEAFVGAIVARGEAVKI